MESPQLAVIRIWAALAWADGEVAKSEAAALNRLIDSADLTDGEKEKARGFLEAKIDLGSVELGGLSAAGKEGIYRAAMRLSAIDGVLADAETELLGRLRGQLGISEEKAKEIQASLPPAKR